MLPSSSGSQGTDDPNPLQEPPDHGCDVIEIGVCQHSKHLARGFDLKGTIR